MKPSSLLVIDSNTENRRDLMELLSQTGYQDIHESDSTDDAWKMMKLRPFQAVICDWEMPDMNGLALLRIIRRDDRFYDIPFFLMDQAFTKLKVMMAGQAGVTGLLVKPVQATYLQAKMAKVDTPQEETEILADEATLEAALRLMEDHDFDQALAMLEAMVKSGETPELYYNIGYIKTAQDKFDEAIPAFRKATQLDRLYARAYEAMGRAYRELGRDEEAQQALQQAADIYMHKKNDKDAEDILNEILDINPNTVNVYNSLGVLYRKRGEFDKAMVQYRKALRIHPKEPYIFYNIGKLYMSMKNLTKAREYVNLALQEDPNFKPAKEVMKAMRLGGN